MLNVILIAVNQKNPSLIISVFTQNFIYFGQNSQRVYESGKIGHMNHPIYASYINNLGKTTLGGIDLALRASQIAMSMPV